MPFPLLGEVCALGAALLWSTSIILFRRSEAVSAQGINLFKNVSASLLLMLTMPILGIGLDASRGGLDWARLIVSGVLGIAIADTMVFAALRRLGAARLAVVETAYTPTIVGMSVLFLDERVGAAFVVGGTLVLGGVLLAQRRDREGTDAERKADAQGVLLGVGGIIAMAIGVILAKPVLEHGHLVEVSLVRLVAGVAGQLIWIALVPGERSALQVLRPHPVWRTLLPASILGAYVAMLLWLGGFKWATASVASVLNQMSTVFTIVLARFWLGESVSRARLVGAMAAVIGAVIIMLT